MIKHLVIAGGGTAGWMTAAMFCHFFKSSDVKITLIESEDIGTVGVGEATIPHLRYFNETIGLNEHDFMRETNATFKLGIEFANWKEQKHSYIHPFGSMGFEANNVPFYRYWSRAKDIGLKADADVFSIATQMAKKGRFIYPSQKGHHLASTFSYAFHIDSSRYAAMLRKFCENSFPNFTRVEGKIHQVEIDNITGDITSLNLENNAVIKGDFFIDCSGFRSLLLSQSLGAKEVDLTQYLPCDSAIAAPTNDIYPDMPYSRATAHTAGWQWKIPLRHRTGNGCVYASQYMSDDEALAHFKKGLSGELLAEPSFIKFKARHMSESWIKNCAAIGLSSGFLEPLESTGIHLIQTAIMKLTELLPNHKNYTQERKEFNYQMHDEYEKIRDFLILHYRTSKRQDSEFWRYIQNMPLPESLQQRIALIRDHGIFDTYSHGLFLESSWAYVYYAQGGKSNAPYHKTEHLDDAALLSQMVNFEKEIIQYADTLPDQSIMLNKIYEGAAKEKWPTAAMNFYGVFS
ncbi:tryptophan halogenase family protein [Marinagarivorans algicola]|uniref:tryptophan halogenase family protein n=1 Tax=Marinagarivorans algicola TaxID=1513270 RepID=UPI003735042F